mmetsp:Transcript_42762/g.49155  ORF Transcript_42762/g.49155 Transcript_42762/m.49155 type:complete len:94 (-) Transcript_42762:672-953(-)
MGGNKSIRLEFFGGYIAAILIFAGKSNKPNKTSAMSQRKEEEDTNQHCQEQSEDNFYISIFLLIRQTHTRNTKDQNLWRNWLVHPKTAPLWQT